MDFLKNVISRAAALPFTIGDRIDRGGTIWSVHDGVRRDDGSECTVFVYDCSQKSCLPLARNALKKARTLRHPGLLSLVEALETESHIYIATERVSILAPGSDIETNKWGLYSITSALVFINGEANSVHGNIRASSIFVSKSGEWKLGGLEVLTRMGQDEQQTIQHYGSSLPDSFRLAPPEVKASGWSSATPAADSWMMGCLIFDTFNRPNSATEHPQDPGRIPRDMVQCYRQLVQSNPKRRMPTIVLLNQGSKSFFKTSLIDAANFIQSIGVKDATERSAFLSSLSPLDSFPPSFLRHKVIPELLKSFEFGNGGPKVLTAILEIGDKFPDSTFEAELTPSIVRAFGSQDRSIRLALLEALSKIEPHISGKTMATVVFPELLAGFHDPHPIIREATVKNIPIIVPHLNDRQRNNDLLKGLSRTQIDEQPGIRTNTTICLGKVASQLGPQTRSKVLVAAFTRSLRDTFVPARNAALMALNATADMYTMEDCAQRIIPAVAPLLIDKEKTIRTQAGTALTTMVNRTKVLASSLPDTIISPNQSAGTTPRMGTPVEGWSSWAFSSLKDRVGAVGTGVMDRVIDDERSASAPAVEVTTIDQTGVLRSLPSPTVSIQSEDRTSHFEIMDDHTNGVDDAWDTLDEPSSKPIKPRVVKNIGRGGAGRHRPQTLNPFAEEGKKRVTRPLPKTSKSFEPAAKETDTKKEVEEDWGAWEA